MKSDLPLTRDLVLIGGGHTHALVLRRWGMAPLPGVRLTLIDPAPATAYTGMLPGYVAGHYDRADLDIDLVKLARFAGARLVVGRAEGIDRAARTIAVEGRPPIAYDVCSVDIGIHSAMSELTGFARFAHAAKPLGPFAEAWNAFRARSGLPRIAVIGGGVAGAELALAMAHGLSGRAESIHVLEAGRMLDGLSGAARRLTRDALDQAGIDCHEDVDVAGIDAEGVTLSDGRRILADFVVGAAGARPHDWLEGTGLALKDGFVRVGPTLQSSDAAIFAAGDCAHLSHAPRPKAGVFAVRAAPVLHHNLRAALSGGRLRPYRPQKHFLKLISLGGKDAIAERGGRAVRHPLLWKWKDRIDRRFMDRFRRLPDMRPDLPPVMADGVEETLGGTPMCSGCGSKIGRGTLGATLASLPVRRDDVESRPGDDAAILRLGGVGQVVTVDHLRAVTEDPVMMTRIAAVHALGDIWAMGAEPQAALASIILPRLSPELQRRTMDEIMTTAAEVIGAEGADIVGGHSSMGAEMTIGFTLTGLVGQRAITLAGARPGDALVLTKPLGTGVILAGEMRGLARGEWVTRAFASMAQPQGAASRALVGAHAMTDVTGFGLAGHLFGICEASDVAAELVLDHLPLLQGAEELAAQGVRSTLWAENRAAVPGVASGGRADLLFDPQTCGGLLAAVPDGDAALAALSEAGAEGTIIGRILDGVPGIRLA